MTSQSMRYSVIIPHFNDADRLQRLLLTIPVARRDLEVLVVDDCSPDQAALEAVKSRWSMVTWLSTPRNAGAGAARNIGLDHARGDRLLFSDSDDEFLPGAFERFDEHVGDEDDLVYFLADAVQEVDGSPSNRADRLNALCMEYRDDPSDRTLNQLRVGHVVPWAKVYSRVFIDKCGVRFEETPVSNDVAFNVLAAVQARHVRVQPVTVYRIHRRPKSLTANPSPEAFLVRVGVKARLASALKALGIKDIPSATGWMVASFSYGPRTAFRTWWLCLISDMRIDVFRLFQFGRWKNFLVRRQADRAEKKAAESSRGHR